LNRFHSERGRMQLPKNWGNANANPKSFDI
jgi:hypothetical protein